MTGCWGGADGDLFVGNFADDIIVGDYARITVEDGKGLSVVRLGQGKLDLITSTLFALYTPDVLAFGPFSITGIPPLGSAATAYEPVYNSISMPVGSSAQDIEPPPPPAPEPSAEEVAFEEALRANPPAAGSDEIKPAPAPVVEEKVETPVVKEPELDCTRIEGKRLGIGELWDQLLDSDSVDEAVGVASDMIDVIITGEPKKLPDAIDCKPVKDSKDEHSANEHTVLEPMLALSSVLGIQAYTKSANSQSRFNRKAFAKLERESEARRYSSW